MEETLVDRVRRVIESTGGSQAEFAARLRIDPSKLSKSLTGVRRFTSLEVALIAELADVSVDWLLNGTSVLPPTVAARAEQLRPSASEVAVKRAEDLDELWSDLVELSAAPEPPRLPRWDGEGSATVQGADLAARAWESVLDAEQHTRMRTELPDVIENVFGINVAFESLPTGLDGLAWVRGGFRLSLVNTATSWTRQRFTLAHELGHVLAGDTDRVLLDADVTPTGRPHGAETRANAFAACFLMPADELRRHVSGTVDDLAFAAAVGHFRVSPSALAWRLLDLHLIDEVSRARYARLSLRACSLIGGWSDDFRLWEQERVATRPPMLMARAAFAAYRSGRTSIRLPAAVLGREPDDLLVALSPSDPDPGTAGTEAVYVP
ncbi:MAG TPA: XRE family transcriptional regulator [Mycobacteriales bacterium]